MFICICHGITDRKIKNLIESGADNVKELQNHCKAGASCGMCLCQLKEMIDETKNSKDELEKNIAVD